MPRYPAITLKPIQRVSLLPLLPSFIVFYYRGCLEFLVRAILRGGIAIPCLSTALLVRSDNGRESVGPLIGSMVYACTANSFEKLQVGWSWKGGATRNRWDGSKKTGRARRGPDLKRETCDATARKFDCWNSWGWYGRRKRSFPPREGGKKPELAENSQLIYASD